MISRTPISKLSKPTRLRTPTPKPSKPRPQTPSSASAVHEGVVNDAENENTQGDGQAVPSHWDRQDQARERVQEPHPREEEPQAQARFQGTFSCAQVGRTDHQEESGHRLVRRRLT